MLFGDTTGVSSTPEKLSTLFDGTRLSFTATAEVNLAYGHGWQVSRDRRVMAGVGGSRAASTRRTLSPMPSQSMS